MSKETDVRYFRVPPTLVILDANADKPEDREKPYRVEGHELPFSWRRFTIMVAELEAFRGSAEKSRMADRLLDLGEEHAHPAVAAISEELRGRIVSACAAGIYVSPAGHPYHAWISRQISRHFVRPLEEATAKREELEPPVEPAPAEPPAPVP